MGKKNKGGGDLGKILIKDRFGSNTKGRKMVDKNSMLHTTELQDGYDWGRLNLQSVTEESSFQEFLSTAELAGKEFQGEKMNVSFVSCKSTVGLLSADERKKLKEKHDLNKENLKIPRRPHWDSSTTAEELQIQERTAFLEWRRNLAIIQEEQGLLMTPFEKNLEFWRQLWRVVERSDVVVQIVDARNPLLFWCEDLEKYVKEVSPNKLNLILINKSDFLTEEQRKTWADYFTKRKIKVAFFSALDTELENIDEDNCETNENDSENEDSTEENETEKSKAEISPENSESGSENVEISQEAKTSVSSENSNVATLEHINNLGEAVDKTAEKLHEIQEKLTEKLESSHLTESSTSAELKNSPDILTRTELISLFKAIHKGPRVTQNLTTVGFIGYPNVGKSSTINSLLLAKKVSVSATPGKTKHFQTLYLDTDLLLCDCPGLVMPSFVNTKSEMVINGILPIDQMRDHVGPVNLVAQLIPRHVFEEKYGLMLPLSEDDDPNRPPTSEELLNAYGYIRGFMTANGQPDNPRSARIILKDYVNGKLLYCHASPDVDQESYHTFPKSTVVKPRPLPPREMRAIRSGNMTSSELDKNFFKEESKGFHAKGVIGKATGVPGAQSASGMQAKPWKQHNRHVNKKKKEKLRRVYAHLDEH